MALRSVGTATFWQQYRALPEPIRRLARVAYRQFLQDPWHPSFRRKKPGALERLHPPIYEFRITRQYRALCQVEGRHTPGFLLVTMSPLIVKCGD
jgi:hypothetical protein